MSWNKGDGAQDRATWIDSGADGFLSNFLETKGVLNWARDLLTQTGAKGTQGGTQYICVDIDRTKCGPPQDCLDYQPVEAWYIHIQMNNLFTSLQKLQSLHIKDAVSAMESDMHDIANTFGVVQNDGSKEVFNALLGVVGSLTGIAGGIGAAGGAAIPLAGNMLSTFSGVVGYAKEREPTTPEAVQGAITDTYGQMFVQAMSNINETVKVIFGDKVAEIPSLKRKVVVGTGDAIAQFQIDAVRKYFQDGLWLDDNTANKVIDLYAKNTQKKMVRRNDTKHSRRGLVSNCD